MTITKNNLERLKNEIFKGKDLEWKAAQNLGPVFQFAETSQAWYSNRKGTDIIYVQPKSPENAIATCYGCGSNVLGMEQAVTGWSYSGPGPCAGTGVRTRFVRYCPKCEVEPRSYDIEFTP